MQRPSLRRPAPAPSSPRPAPPPPPPHLPRPQSPPLPAALLPPKKRFLRYASTLIPTPPPPTTNAPATSVPPAAEALVSPTPSPLPPVAPPPPKAADPSTPPIPTADAKSPSNRPPPKAAAPSTPLIPAADTTLPSTMPPSADSAPAAEPAPERKARKRKVIIRKVLVKVPKGTLAARKAAAAAASAASADGAEACKPNETLCDKGCNTGKPNETLGDKGCSHLGCKQGQSSSVRNCKVAAAAAAAREALIKRKQLLLEGRALSTKTAIIDRDAILEGMMEGLLEEPTLARNPATDCSAPVEEGVGMSKAESTSMKEVFVGGLHYDAREEDVRAAYRKAGEITQVRLIQNSQTGKNKGYCFVRYREAAQAKKAVAELGNVKICGKRCRTAAQDVNNIEKKRKKEDVNIKDSLPKPVEKSKQNREQYVSNISQSDMTVAKSETLQIAGDKKSSTNPDLLNIPREQATRRHRQTVLAPIQGHHLTYSGLNRASSTLDNYSSDRTRSHSRPHHGSSTLYYVNSTAFPANAYDFLPASYYGVTRSSVNSQIRRAGPHQPEQTYGGRHY